MPFSIFVVISIHFLIFCFQNHAFSVVETKHKTLMKANQYHQGKGRKQLKITMNLLDVGCYCIYLPTSINDAYELSAFEMWKKDDKRLSTNLFVIDGKFTKKPSWMHTHRGGMALTNGVNPLVLAIKNK